MTLLYFLPVMIAIIFLLVHVARGGTLSFRGNPWQIAAGVAAIIAVAGVGMFLAYAVT